MKTLVLLLGLLLARQAEAPTVRADIDRAEMTVGDRVTVTIAIDHDSAAVIDWPSPSKLGSFDVLETFALAPTTMEGRTTSITAFVMTVFEVGELEVPPVEIIVRGPSDTGAVTLSTNPIPLRVVSVGVDEAGDIRDIKPPLGIARNWLLWIGAIVAIAAVIATGAWVYRRYRKGQVGTGTEMEPLGPPRPAHELALEALDHLEAAQFPQRGEVQRHYTEAAEIIRTYLERQFGIIAMEMVSEDILRELEPLVDDGATSGFRDFFRDVDLVKFAKLRPPLEACHTIVSAARRLVEMTKLIEEPVTSVEDHERVEPPVAAAHGSTG